MFTVKQCEPDGWLKAFSVLFAGKHVAFFSWRDSAEYYIREHFAENQ